MCSRANHALRVIVARKILRSKAPFTQAIFVAQVDATFVALWVASSFKRVRNFNDIGATKIHTWFTRAILKLQFRARRKLHRVAQCNTVELTFKNRWFLSQFLEIMRSKMCLDRLEMNYRKAFLPEVRSSVWSKHPGTWISSRGSWVQWVFPWRPLLFLSNRCASFALAMFSFSLSFFSY